MQIKINNKIVPEILLSLLQPDFEVEYIFVNSRYVGFEFSNSLSIILTRLKEEKLKGSISIKLFAATKQIELTAFSILLLITKQSPHIRITFDFVEDVRTLSSKDEKRYSALKAKIYSYINFAKFTAGDINFFTKQHNQSETKELSSIQYKYPRVSFLPVLYIDKTDLRTERILFDKDFLWKIKETEFDQAITEIFKDCDVSTTNASELNNFFYETLANNFLLKRGYNIFHFVLLCYARCLGELRAFYLLEDKGDYFRTDKRFSAKFLKSQAEPFRGLNRVSEYFREIKSMDSRLKGKTAFFLLFFSFTLYNKLVKFREEDRHNSADFLSSLRQTFQYLFDLCERLEMAMRELISNIKLHSTEGKGVIQFRIYDSEDILGLKAGSGNPVISYIESVIENFIGSDKQAAEFIDINIFDISTKGILETYDGKLEKKTGFSLKDLYKASENTPHLSIEKYRNNYGLLFFSDQMIRNNGFFSVSTTDNEKSILYDSFSHEQSTISQGNGTAYNIILPLFIKEKVAAPRIIKEEAKEIYLEGQEQEILYYSKGDFTSYLEIKTPIDTSPKLITINCDEAQFASANLVNENIIKKLKEKSPDLFSQRSTDILVLYITEQSPIIRNPGDVYRLLASLQENTLFQDLIVIIPSLDLLHWVEAQYRSAERKSALKFPILFYYWDHAYFKPFLFFNSEIEVVLEFNRRYLSCPFEEPLTVNIAGAESSSKYNIGKSTLFYKGTYKVKEFDSILDYKGKKLYSYFLLTCLNTEIDEKSGDPNFQGYKLANGHFRLGSKIHIRDFYYAKRLFQVSNTVTHLAVQIAYYLKEHIFHASNKEVLGFNKITLLGYAKYSELLVFKLKKYLENHLGKGKEIVLNIFKDYDSDELMYQNIEPDSLHLVIIPISSTFSTSVKIKTALQEKYKVPPENIFKTFINVINVADEEYDQFLKAEKKFEDCTMLLANNWLRPQNTSLNLINIKDADEGDFSQFFFLQVFTKWYEIGDCELCFKSKTEPPLVETDKASVTPLLIFGEPVKYPVELNKDSLYSFKFDYYHYGHFRIDKRDNIHFIEPTIFLQKHEEGIRDWLIKKKRDLGPYIAERKACIISPDGKYNSKFVHYVNEYLFRNTANVILYNAESDYISNFKEFYGDILKNASLVVYVDDQISTARTFYSIDQYIKSCGNEKQTNLIICMISRITSVVYNEIESTIGQLKIGEQNAPAFYTFRQFSVPTVISSHLRCPICIHQGNYAELAKIANLDPTEYTLYKGIQKFNRKSDLPGLGEQTFHGYDDRISEGSDYEKIYLKSAFNSFWENPFKHLMALKFLIEEYLHTHLSEILAKREDDSPIFMFKEVDKMFRDIFDGKNPYSYTEIRFCLVKVISQPPFVNNYIIRKRVFKFLQHKLNLELSPIRLRIAITDSRFRTVKLYLKRISYLKSNFLLREENYNKLLNYYKSVEKTDQRNTLIRDREKHVKIILDNLFKILKDKQELTNILASKDRKKLALILQSPNLDKRFITAVVSIILGNYFPLFKKINKEQQYLLTQEDIPITVNDLLSIIYSARALKNIETIFKTRTDFQYYVAILIKEITINNETKAIYFENKLSKWYEKLDENLIPASFKQLIRIIKLENTGILKKYSDKLLEKIRQLSFSEYLDEELANKKRLHDESKEYNLDEKSAFLDRILNRILGTSSGKIAFYPLLEFLNIEFESRIFPKNATIVSGSELTLPERIPKLPLSINGKEFNVSESFFHFITLMWFLDGDEKGISPHDWSLEYKMKFINNRLLNILQVRNKDYDAEAHTFVIYGPLDESNNVTANNVTIYSDTPELFSLDYENNKTLVPYIIKGLKLRDGGGPQNIFEFINTGDGKWKSMKPYYKVIAGDTITEFVDEYDPMTKEFKKGFFENYLEGSRYFSSKKHVLFYRITNMEYLKNTDPDTGNVLSEITVKPQAVIVIASNNPTNFQSEKIRYLLLLKKYLSKFFKHHYENDSYRNSLFEKSITSQYRLLSHGTAMNIEYLEDTYKEIIRYKDDQIQFFGSFLSDADRNKFTPTFENETSDPPNIGNLLSEYDLLFNVSLNEYRIAEVLAKNAGNIANVYDELNSIGITLKIISAEELESAIRNISKSVATSKLEDSNNEDYFNNIFIPYEDISTSLHPKIIEIIFFEILRNIKKRNKNDAQVEVTWQISNVDDVLEIKVSNYYSKGINENKGYGLKMIQNLVRNIYDGEIIGVPDETVENKFITTLTLKMDINGK